jgi:hypothetical protein
MNLGASIEPQFIIIGIVKTDGAYRMWATNRPHLTEVAVTADFGKPAEYALKTHLTNMLVVDGKSPRECMQRIAEIWANEEERKSKRST